MKWLTIAALTLGLTGCGSGNEERCREAVRNIFTLTGRTRAERSENAWVRSCRANSSGKSIDCMVNAKSVEELAQCEGFKEVAGDESKPPTQASDKAATGKETTPR